MLDRFPITRWVLVVIAMIATAWLASRWSGKPTVDGPDPARRRGGSAMTYLDANGWERELSDERIQAFWRPRRARLDSLSRLFRAEPDPTCRESLRGRIEALLTTTEREVYELRLAHARMSGRHELARRLERRLADLPSPSPVTTDTTSSPVSRPGGRAP